MKTKTIFVATLLVILPLTTVGCSATRDSNPSNDITQGSNNFGKQNVTLLSSLRSPTKSLWYEIWNSKGVLSTDGATRHVILLQDGKVTSYEVNDNFSKFANLSITEAQNKAIKELDKDGQKQSAQGQIQLMMDDSGNNVEGERLAANKGVLNSYTDPDDQVQIISPTKILNQYFAGYVYTSRKDPEDVTFMVTPVSKNTVIDFDKPGQKYTKRILKQD
ncbi:Hypothetical protein LCAKO_1432 [Lacticaseibacillus paracasei subsp. paracasei]|uniref:Lipoprotein n=1 Tax=Lacticaseibacillus paracasei subsp. paracasei TaxID=47714 RepID=A0AAP9KV78_LACPA|nr:hypothetical protein [Lacticaseibacillus paracasei]QGV17957.1 Hypothetical protein LCAKO_1432 [Lacticaseibacillus paracasei subsp. paracasei]